MKLNQLDNDRMLGTQPIRHALRWLQTLQAGTGTEWNPEQLKAAKEALDGARRHLEQDVLAIVATPAEDAVTRIADLGSRDWETFEHREDPAPRAPELQAPGAEPHPVHAASINLANWLDSLQHNYGGLSVAIREWKEAGMPVAAPPPVVPVVTVLPHVFKDLDEDSPHYLLNAVTDGLVDGLGASEDHQTFRGALANAGFVGELVDLIHRATCHARAGYRLTLQEVKDLSAMVWGAPVSDKDAEGIYQPLLQMYETVRQSGRRPKDPADMTKAEARAHWLQFETTGVQRAGANGITEIGAVRLHMEAAQPIPGLALRVGKDGVWLCFSASDGKQAMFQPHVWALERAARPSLVTSALEQWAVDRQADAAVQS